MNDKDEVELEIRIAARPETVFAFLTEPEKMLRWIGVTAALDPKPGGIFRLDPNGGNVSVGEFVEVVANRRVVFTWGWEGSAELPPGSSSVEFTLVPEGDGTRLTLRHRGLPPAWRDRHESGWKHYVARLQIVASGGDPGPDPLATSRAQTTPRA